MPEVPPLADRVAALADVSPQLIVDLQRLADAYGPRGVAETLIALYPGALPDPAPTPEEDLFGAVPSSGVQYEADLVLSSPSPVALPTGAVVDPAAVVAVIPDASHGYVLVCLSGGQLIRVPVPDVATRPGETHADREALVVAELVALIWPDAEPRP